MGTCKHRGSCKPVFRLVFESETHQRKYGGDENKEGIQKKISLVKSDPEVMEFAVEVNVSQIPCLAETADSDWIHFQKHSRVNGEFLVKLDLKFSEKRAMALRMVHGVG